MPAFSKATGARSPCGGAATIDWISPARSPSCVCSADGRTSSYTAKSRLTSPSSRCATLSVYFCANQVSTLYFQRATHTVQGCKACRSAGRAAGFSSGNRLSRRRHGQLHRLTILPREPDHPGRGLARGTAEEDKLGRPSAGIHKKWKEQAGSGCGRVVLRRRCRRYHNVAAFVGCLPKRGDRQVCP